MKATRNKKGEGAIAMPYGLVVGFIILFVLVVIVLAWYGGLGNKIITILERI